MDPDAETVFAADHGSPRNTWLTRWLHRVPLVVYEVNSSGLAPPVIEAGERDIFISLPSVFTLYCAQSAGHGRKIHVRAASIIEPRLVEGCEQ